MTINELRRWFEFIPHKFDNINIQYIDIDLTDSIEKLNLIITAKETAIIVTASRKPTYIDNGDKNEDL